jgi:hypothetical protein
MIESNMAEFLSRKEHVNRLKVKLIKIAAMLNEDEIYKREDAYYDILNAIDYLDEMDLSAYAGMSNSKEE